MDHDETTAALSAPSHARELIACWESHVTRFELSGSTLDIGRGNACAINLPHASVSRLHARLHFSDQNVEIEDLQSANGTRLDGTPVTGRVPFPTGAILEVGAIRLLLRAKTGPSAPAMVDVRRLVDKFAGTNVSIILLGETGVGKEVMAEELHARSRSGGPLVRINCAGLSASLIESELFGHERGAFTGAIQAKAGLIESADGGTLFLDELGEMPEETQAKLLRVLESREVRRVGALKPKPIDVRFISATHRDLRALAVMGKFREDLLFRLNGFTIRIPPLRERRDEVVGLANAFLASTSARLHQAVPTLSEAARAILEAYRFPGNIRELRNVIDRAIHVCEGDVILTEHLMFDPPLAAPVPAPPPSSLSMPPSSLAAPPGDPSSSSLSKATDASERDRIVRALAEAGGNQATAATALGITRRILGYKMDKLGLPRPRRK